MNESPLHMAMCADMTTLFVNIVKILVAHVTVGLRRFTLYALALKKHASGVYRLEDNLTKISDTT